MRKIKGAWIENDGLGAFKLCVLYDPDDGAENFGCFDTRHEIRPDEFVGLSIDDACNKFNSIVYNRTSRP